MRLITPLVVIAGLALAAGCGEKKPPEAAAEAAVAEAPAPEAEPEPEPEAEPEPPPPPADNADLSITVMLADGTQQAGHVKRIERSADWFAEEGWTDEERKLTLTAESNTEMLDITWEQIARITVTQGNIVNDTSCTYTSETNPWTYTCELKTPTQVALKDGRSFEITSRHKWKFIYDDGAEVEFWLAKHPVRQQDEVVQSFDRGGENTDMYAQLQDRMREEVKSLVKTVSIQ